MKKTIEEKAKAYDEALERARQIHNEGKAQCFDVMTKVFPELAESEDEKIMKELIRIVDGYFSDKTSQQRKAYIAWLEKQGEHYNFRQKIQVGDQVTRNEDGVLVNLSQLKRVAKPEQKPIECSDDIQKALLIYLDWLDGRKESSPRGGYTIKDMIAWVKQNSSVNKDLEAEIVSLSKQFPEVSFAKLSRIAVRVAKWQKGKIVDVVKQYANKGEKNYQDTLDNYDEGERSNEFYWDGYRDCANGINRELED